MSKEQSSTEAPGKGARNPLAIAIVVAMVSGGICGWVYPPAAEPLSLLAAIFLRLIQSIIAPVLFGVLVTAVAGSSRNLGRLGWKALLYFELNTTVALLLGWFAVLATGIGYGSRIEATSSTVQPPA